MSVLAPAGLEAEPDDEDDAHEEAVCDPLDETGGEPSPDAELPPHAASAAAAMSAVPQAANAVPQAQRAVPQAASDAPLAARARSAERQAACMVSAERRTDPRLSAALRSAMPHPRARLRGSTSRVRPRARRGRCATDDHSMAAARSG